MNVKDYFVLSFKSIKHRRLRAWLTMLGIFIGIAAVVSLISLGEGLQNAIEGEFEAIGKDKIIIMPDIFAPPGTVVSESLILTSDDLEFVSGLRGVKEAVGYVTKIGQTEFKDESYVGYVGGVSEEDISFWQEDFNFLIMEEGRVFEEGESYKAVVGSRYATGDVFSKEVGLRDVITVEGVELKVVGIMERTGDPNDDSTVYISKDILRELFDISEEESMIFVKSSEGYDASEVALDIEEELRDFRDEEEGEETFSVQTSEELLETFSNIFGIVQAVLIGIAAISLLVGGIGIMNTMYTSVLERTKDIGIMKAIGARNKDVLLLFLVESGVLGLAGGFIGVVIGVLISKSVEYVAFVYLGTELLQASVSVGLIVFALGFGFFVGCISGVFPAMQAAKMKPVDALRYE